MVGPSRHHGVGDLNRVDLIHGAQRDSARGQQIRQTRGRSHREGRGQACRLEPVVQGVLLHGHMEEATEVCVVGSHPEACLHHLDVASVARRIDNRGAIVKSTGQVTTRAVDVDVRVGPQPVSEILGAGHVGVNDDDLRDAGGPCQVGGGHRAHGSRAPYDCDPHP